MLSQTPTPPFPWLCLLQQSLFHLLSAFVTLHHFTLLSINLELSTDCPSSSLFPAPLVTLKLAVLKFLPTLVRCHRPELHSVPLSAGVPQSAEYSWHSLSVLFWMPCSILLLDPGSADRGGRFALLRGFQGIANSQPPLVLLNPTGQVMNLSDSRWWKGERTTIQHHCFHTTLCTTYK